MKKPPPKKSRQLKKSQTNPFSPSLKLILIGVITVLLIFLPTQDQQAVSLVNLSSHPEVVPRKLLELPTPAPFPVKFTPNPPPELTAEGIVVIDVASGTLLYEKNSHTRLLPASTTKIMTALVAIGEYQLEEVVEVNQVISEGQVMGLVSGEKISVENLLYGILVHSANDAAFALAEHDRDGVSGFVNKMNQQAKELFLVDTHFVNPMGFDDPDQYTSAFDLARLSVYALNNYTFRKMVGVVNITVPDLTFTRFHYLKNINELLGKIPGVSGLKTGWTEEAGECLAASVTRNGHEIVTVLLRSQDRFGETEMLVDWIFANFEWKDFTETITQ